MNRTCKIHRRLGHSADKRNANRSDARVGNLTATGKAVFLSYASEDAQAAETICAALRSAGVEVWFDKSALRGGDEWDAAIRQHIKACSLFLPVISRNTQARVEGYFRLEWKLAVDRSHLIAADHAFLLPIVIDDTPDATARVPDRFREVQWTRLPGGQTSPAFAQRVARLLNPQAAGNAEAAATPAADAGAPAATPLTGTARSTRPKVALYGVLALAVLALGILGVYRGALSPSPEATAPAAGADASATQGATTSDFNPPPHSIAVLPFVNMSGDPKQDYFSDGLSEELLNSLVTVRDLQVAARTSSFSFKGTNAKLANIGKELNVGAILEGSVRKDGNHVRITAQLSNAITGFNLWSQTYDRDLKNILALQTEIATAVTKALKATLLIGAAAAIERGGTSNPQALDAYLRGESMVMSSREAGLARIATYDEALRLDPSFAKAYARKALALASFAGSYEPADRTRLVVEQALEIARKAVQLAPDLVDAHLAVARILADGLLDFKDGKTEFERALALAPGDARALSATAYFLSGIRDFDAALANARTAVTLDPVNSHAYVNLGFVFLRARRYAEAVDAFSHARSGANADPWASGLQGFAYIGLGQWESAVRSCSAPPVSFVSQVCMAVSYDKLARTAEAQATLQQMQAQAGDSMAYQYAEVLAQWGDIPGALKWLETAYRLKDPGLVWIKTDLMLDPLLKDARYEAIVSKLNFPN